jgi:molybdopterin synthase catalytic subunit
MKNIQFIEGPLSTSLVSELIELNKLQLSTGAYTIFCGQVRADQVELQKVKGIEYTIYESMANKILDEQLDQLKSLYQIQHINVIHSKGFVAVGKLSVILFITSAHRNQALEAQQALLPIIKFEVPIWKKEILEDASFRWA